MHSNKSYCVMKTIWNTKLYLSCLQSDSSLKFIGIKEFSTNFDNMDGSGDKKSFVLSYEELLQAQKNNNVLIIDVREQREINETGKLPGSIHIPMGNVANMLNLTDDQFKKQFEKPKPNKDTQIILSCKSGMRSATVQQELQKLAHIIMLEDGQSGKTKQKN
ncbi:hypothetical protein PV325_008927 [Microctonus aethiopoides]|nr:hypothetical protein PV325_008927 [Microctonus aethiopoides]